MKRFLSCNTSEIVKMKKEELFNSIKASEGRIILVENVANVEPMMPECTNAEVSRAFGADLILLNGVDILNPKIGGLDVKKNQIKELKKLVGRPIGINLEPVDHKANLLEQRRILNPGRKLSLETIKALNDNGFDFVCLTGNPSTGVTVDSIKEAIKLTKKHFKGLIIAGKMHGAGTSEPIYDEKYVKDFIKAGADIIMIPSPGTVPGSTLENCIKLVDIIKKSGKLSMGALGTSQESSGVDTIKQIALWNKMVGFDIHHIGDGGPGGLTQVENIYELSKAVRGKRHTLKAMCISINR